MEAFFSQPWAFLYAMVWIPSLIFVVGLHYYQTYDKLPLKLKVLKWICLAVVLTLPFGLTIATDAASMMKK